MATRKYVVHFVISDTFYAHLPDRKQNNIQLGTSLQYVVESMSKAIKLANQLAHLTTGIRENVFDETSIKRQKLKRVKWSNNMRTHHVEITPHFEHSHFTERTKKGESEEQPASFYDDGLSKIRVR